MTPRLVRILFALSASALVSPMVADGDSLVAQAPTTAKLQGYVRDSAGVALVQAHVIFLGTQHQALTDSTGFYIINSVPPGRYDVEAHANGKAASRVSGLQVRAGETLTQDFKMLSARPAPPARRR